MEYTTNLESLKGFLNALRRRCAHRIRAWKIVYVMVKVRKYQKLLMVVKKGPGSLYFDS